MLQLDLGITPLSKIEVVSMINVVSISNGWLFYYLADRTQKYNPKVYMSAQNSVASIWATEYQKVLSRWPESSLL